MAQGHLELAGVQGVVPPEIPEAALARHPEGPLALALAPHPMPLGLMPELPKTDMPWVPTQ